MKQHNDVTLNKTECNGRQSKMSVYILLFNLETYLPFWQYAAAVMSLLAPAETSFQSAT